MKIGDRIEGELKRREWSEGELARRAAVPQPTVHRIIKGESKNPRQDNVQAIAKAFGCSAEWLWTGTGKGPAGVLSEFAPASTAADKVREMLEKVGKGLTSDARQQIIRAAAEGSEIAQPSNVVTGDFQRPARLTDGDILIPQYDVRASMGHGQMPSDYVEFMRNVVVSGPQLEKLGLDFTSPANLSIITGWGQSMAPTIQDKDPVIVDRGVTEFSGDAIYVLTWQDHLFIKRVHLAGGGKLKIISDCRPDDPELVTPDEVAIHAKVLLVWNARKV